MVVFTHYGYAGLRCFCFCLLSLPLQLQFPDRADVLALMRRHPSWPGSGSGNTVAAAESPRLAPAQEASPGCRAGTPAVDNVAAADSEDGDSDSDGADGVSDDAQDDMQDEVMAPAAALPRGRLRTYTVDEQEVMHDLNLRNLANVTCRTLVTGAVCWNVKLSAEGLLTKSRVLQGESSPILSGRDLWALGGISLIPCGCLMRPCFRPERMCD
jgi:hypothetical protein